MDVADEAIMSSTPSARSPNWTFLGVLAVICIAALAIRLLNAFAWLDYKIGGDALYFHGQADALAKGWGFVDGVEWLRTGATKPSALHPPAYPALLSLVSFFGATSEAAHRVASCVVGTATVAVLGLLGRRIGGRSVGLVVAATAAIAPALWIADSQLLSEGLYGFGIALTLLAAYRYYELPTTLSVILLVGAVSLAALTRGEGLLLFPLLVLPLVLRHVRSETRRTMRLLATAVVSSLLFVTPWLLYNTIRFDQITYSHNSGAAMMLTNCDAAYEGSLLGYWSVKCFRRDIISENEATEDAAARRVALGYMGDHAARVPVVALARIGRMLDVYRVSQGLSLAANFEGRGEAQTRIQLGVYYCFVALSVPGLIILVKRRVPIWPLASMALLTVLTALLIYGNVRFRVPLEIVLIVLSGSAIANIVHRAQRRQPSNR